MSERQKLAAALARVKELQGVTGREYTAAELAEIDRLKLEIPTLREKVDRFDRTKADIDAIAGGVGDGEPRQGFLDLCSKFFVRELASGMLADNGVGRKALVTGGSVAPVQIVSDPVPEGRPATGLLQVIPVIGDSPARFEYLQQVQRELNAAPVSAGGTKPTSILGLEKVEATLNVVAHVSEPIDVYMLQDAPTLETFVGSEMAYGVQRALEAELVNGTGTAPSLAGILSATGVLSQAFATDMLTSTRKAITLLEDDGLIPSAFVMSPADWEAIELSRTDGGNGKLEMVDQPVDRAARRLCGVPVVTSPEVVAGQSLLLSQDSVALRVDKGLQLRVSENVGTDFETNQVRFRAELRAEVQLNRPGGVVVVETAEIEV
ncbi:phage major capsid protein [Rhodococcus pyridinivorans]|uniref:phage major capsid protein n=1 Tax=Rhodococcus pyridinivorans TaxID=103816 RepID=UPI001C30DDCE|nr:phage major capsid protein [Rhodococcus pyridinivorans]QXF81893.1 phage major capsid protein [Rhodococcus pyridinivorans]